MDKGDFMKAKDFIDQALKIDEKLFGNEHYIYAKDLHALGLYFKKTGNIEKAKEFFERSLNLCKNILGEKHHKTKKVKEDLASIEH